MNRKTLLKIKDSQTDEWIKLSDTEPDTRELFFNLPKIEQEVLVVEIEKDTEGLIRIFSVTCGKVIKKSEEYVQWYMGVHREKIRPAMFIEEKWGYHEQFDDPNPYGSTRTKKFLKYSSITCLRDIYSENKMKKMADNLRRYDWVNDKATLSHRFGPKYDCSENIHAVISHVIKRVMSISLEPEWKTDGWQEIDTKKEVYWIPFEGKIPKSVPTYERTNELDINFVEADCYQ